MKRARQRHSRTEHRRRPGAVSRLKWRQVFNPYSPTEVLSADQVESIHLASLKVLRDSGIRFLSADARTRLGRAGADVDEAEQQVRFDPDMIEGLLKTAPKSFTVKARNQARSVLMGENAINFATVGGPSFVTDLDRGRRGGTLDDLRDFFRIAHGLEIFHFCGASPFEPLELPAESRHLDKYLAAITLHDRIWMASMLGAYRARDALEMLRIVHGLSEERLPEQALTVGNINVNSPRQVDVPMAEAMIEFAKLGQPVLVTPFTLLGAMAPATMAGALVQQNAEALACIALIQAVNPGAPVIYGSFSSNVDMRTGAPAFGTPEYARTTLASGQLARRYGLPLRTSGSNAANAPDAQSAYETTVSIWSSVMGHANLLLHGGGWMEGGLAASFEKLVIDAEILQIFAETLRPMLVDADTLAVEAISEVPPGGHFFGSPHTLQRYEDAFYTPLLSDWRNFETWQEDGAVESAERANRIWKALLEEYDEPMLDQSVAEELDAYVRRRKSEIQAGKADAVLG